MSTNPADEDSVAMKENKLPTLSVLFVSFVDIFPDDPDETFHVYRLQHQDL